MSGKLFITIKNGGAKMLKILFFFILLPICSLIYSIPEEDLYKKIKDFYTTEFPEKFLCEIEGETLKNSIDRLPKEAIKDQKNLKIVLLFHKEWGSRVILKGVEEPFMDRFSYIENIFEFIIPFVGKKTYQDFVKKYEIYDIRENVFKMKKKLTSGSFLEITLSKNIVINVKEYKENKLLMNVFIDYKKIEKYAAPINIKVFYYDDNKLRTLKFDLKNYDFNPNIKEEDFLG